MSRPAPIVCCVPHPAARSYGAAPWAPSGASFSIRRHGRWSAVGIGVLLASAAAWAGDTSIWIAPANGLWSDRSAWSPSVPQTGGAAEFGGIASAAPFVVTFTEPVALATLAVRNQRPTLDMAWVRGPNAEALTLAGLTIQRPGAGATIEPLLGLRHGAVRVNGTATVGSLLGTAALTLEDSTLSVTNLLTLFKSSVTLIDANLEQGTTPLSELSIGMVSLANVELTGASTLSTTGRLRIGLYSGQGTVTAGPGCAITARELQMGGPSNLTSGHGTLVLQGGTLTLASTCAIGAFGYGALELGSGGSVQLGASPMGVGQGGTGVITVDGLGTIHGDVKLGGPLGGAATMQIEGRDAALVIDGDIVVNGKLPFATTLTIVDGSLAADAISLGGRGSRIRCDGGLVTADAFTVSPPSPSNGQRELQFLNGGSIVADAFVSNDDIACTVTLGARSQSAIAPPISVAGHAEVNGALTVELASGFVPVVGQPLPIVAAGSIGGRFRLSSIAAPFGIPGLVRHAPTTIDVRFVDAIDGLTIEGPQRSPAGYPCDLRAMAAYAGEHFDMTDLAGWTSDDPTVAAFDPEGVLIGVRPGQATVHAMFAGQGASFILTVTGSPGLLPLELISRPGLGESNGNSAFEDERAGHRMSGDGRTIAFGSTASNLIPFDTNGTADVFVWQLAADDSEPMIERVSVPNAGVPGVGGGVSIPEPSMSRDGRFVAFSSNANLVGGPTSPALQCYIRDRSLALTERVSVSTAGSPASSGGESNAISDDGRFVLFTSVAANLVAGDTNASADVFLRDRLLGTTSRVSQTAAGQEWPNGAHGWDMSGDGRFILLEAMSVDGLPAESGSQWRYFVVDRETGTIENMMDGFTAEGGWSWSEAHISHDGSVVAFSTKFDAPGFAASLAPRVFVRDRVAGTLTGIGANPDGTWRCNGGPECSSYSLSLSNEGRYVSFVTTDSGYGRIPFPSSQPQIFRFDRATGDVELVSMSVTGELAPDEPEWTAISGDGRTVAFSVVGDHFAPNDSNGFRDVIVRRFGSGVPGDVNGDALVDATDLATLIAAWGTPDRESDLDGDGSVGPLDLALLLGGWSTSAP